jgi:FkbM family methyltransferase
VRGRPAIASQLAKLHASLRQWGLVVPARSGRSANLRLLPSAAIRAALRVDLDLLAPLVGPGAEFVQIGAFDGLANDPLHDLIMGQGWRGVLVEPQPDAFTRLQQTYAGVEGLTFLNVAVSDRRGPMTFWRIGGSAPDDPWWRGQVSSFSREHVERHIRDRPHLASRIEGLTVPTMSLTEVLSRAARPVQVLQVDAEGHDAAIVDSMDLDRHHPTIVRFEHRHLRAAAHARTVNRLAAFGYRIAVNEDDTIAMLHTPGRGTSATA